MNSRNDAAGISPVEIQLADIVEPGVLIEVRMMPEHAALALTFEWAEVKGRGMGLVRLSAGSVAWLQYVTRLPAIINDQNGCDYIIEVQDSPLPGMLETTKNGTYLHHPLSSVWLHSPLGRDSEPTFGELVHVRLGSRITIEFACLRSQLKLTFEPEIADVEG
jgi:hypothetical protein